MHPSIGKIVYNIGQFVNGEPVAALLRELDQSQWIPTEELHNLQWVKIKNLLKHAYESVPFYRSRFESLEITPDDITTWDDFNKIPFLTREDIRIHKESILSKNPIERSIRALTSGSSGKPISIQRCLTSWGYNHANSFRALGWYGANIGDKWAKISGTNAEYPKRIFEEIKNIIFNRIKLPTFELSGTTCLKFFRKMKNFSPAYIYGYPSAIYYFASVLDDEGIDGRDLKLSVIVCSGETLKDYYRNYIEKFFDCKVSNDYAAAEVGTIAIECPDGNMHIPLESIYVENINDTISCGDNKELVVTDLHSFNMPIIRYRIGDFADLTSRKCTCGRKLPLMEPPKGRISSMITTADGKIMHSIIFDFIFEQLMGIGCDIKQYQVIQKSLKDFTVKIVGEINEEQVNSIEAMLKRYLGKNSTLELLSVKQISNSPSGKFKNFINLLKA